MKRLAHTLILSSVFVAATAVAASNPPAVSSESQLPVEMVQQVSSSDFHFSGLYQSVLPTAATEHQLIDRSDVQHTAGTFCPVGFSIALTDHSNEGHLGGKQC